MANHTQSLSDTLDLFGIEPTNLWGVLVWGVNKWGYGDTKATTDVISVSVQTEPLSDGYTYAVVCYPDSYGTETLSDAFPTDAAHTLSDSQAMTGLGTSETLRDQAGYYYSFTLPTSEAESRNISTYTSGTAASTAWTAASSAGGTWT